MGAHKDQVMRSRIGKRVCTHPRRLERKKRAFQLIQRQILSMEAGLLPTAKEWVTADYYEARYGDPAMKIKKAKITRDNLHRNIKENR